MPTFMHFHFFMENHNNHLCYREKYLLWPKDSFICVWICYNVKGVPEFSLDKAVSCISVLWFIDIFYFDSANFSSY